MRVRTRGPAGLLVLLAACLAVPPAVADGPALEDETRAEVVKRLAELIEEKYVDVERGAAIAGDLRQRLEEGAYDDAVAPADLAGLLSGELKPHDRHFRVDWQPPESGAAPVDGHGEEAERQWMEYSRLQNYGFRRLEILPGNVGYLDLRYFDGVRWAGGTAIAALDLLARADAVVVDLRQNGGGEPDMVQLLISRFLPQETHYNSLYWRQGDLTRQYWTLPYIAADRHVEEPLFVLTSARTGSAAEEFAYALQAQGRATLVGQTTVGAANPGDVFDLGHGFSAFVSNGKAVNPVTGTNWERVGVKPDVEVPAEEALDVAYAEALRRLLPEAESEVRRRGLEWALEAVEVRLAPVAVDPAGLARYAGTYGDRQIRLAGDHLTYQRGNRTVYPMVPLGDDRFLAAGKDDFRLHFERDAGGGIVRLVDTWADGHVEANPRAE